MSFDQYSDIIYTREIIERIEELEEIAAAEGDEQDGVTEELDDLRSFARDLSDYAEDFKHGETVIRDSYFETYAQELADDLGYMDRDGSHNWPFTCIDWAQAAQELQVDYTAVEWHGVTYWVR